VAGARAPQPQVVTQVVEEAKTQILVAKSAIGIGERLGPTSVEWQDWPQGAMRSEYVSIAAMPDAPSQLTDAVARFEFFPGEPIREAKLVRSDQGYLSAVLAQGKRGVSVGVTAASSAGGFVVPNDHVDVVLTTASASGQRSEVILSDVRVLAIGKRLGEMGASGGNTEGDGSSPQPVTFDSSAIATLELDPPQARNADQRLDARPIEPDPAFGHRFQPRRFRAENGHQPGRPHHSLRQEQSVITGTTPGEPQNIDYYSEEQSGFSEDIQAQPAIQMPQVLPQ
jgi:pilus assembly protein CpaB